MEWQELDREFIGLALFSSLIAIAEILIFLGYTKAAISVEAIVLVALVLSAAYMENRIYPILMLLPLFRLLNMAMPIFFNLTLYSFAFVYAPMFLPIFLIIKSGSLTREELGLTLRGIHYYLPLGIAVGLVLGWGEYQVIRPQVLTPDIGIRGLLELSAIMILFVGLVEEFVFRSALQTVASEKLGRTTGLLMASVLFGLMHGGYRLPMELVFTFIAGLVFGYLFLKTASLFLVTLAHGITNVSLFLIVPIYPSLLLPAIVLSLMLFAILSSFRLIRQLPLSSHWAKLMKSRNGKFGN